MDCEAGFSFSGTRPDSGFLRTEPKPDTPNDG